MTSAALSFGFVFDHPLSSDLGPLESLLALPLGQQTLGSVFERQVLLPRETRKLTRPLRFNWKRLSAAISGGGTIFFSATRELPQPAANRLELSAECLAPDQLEQARRSGEWPPAELPYRYQGHLSVGTHFLEQPRTVDALLERIFETWASRIALRAGAVVADASFDDAEAYARGSGGMPGSAVDRRTSKLKIASRAWGLCAREPEWGTYLTREHADAIGGVSAIRSAAEPYRILEGDNIVFVQLTPNDQALAPATDGKREKLLRLMEPIVAKPLSRD